MIYEIKKDISDDNSKSLFRRSDKNNISNTIKKEGNKLNSNNYIKKQFKCLILDYINSNLSSIEKDYLNLTKYGNDDKSIKKKITKMLLKRKYKIGSSFNKKFKSLLKNKIYQYLQNKHYRSNQSNRSAPFIIILCSSAMRCIHIQKKLNSSKFIKSKKLRWAYAFGKHKNLKEQISYFKNDNNDLSSIDLIFATPKRLIQLIKADCFDLDQLKYIVIDYIYRDAKLKRFFDINDIRKEFLKLFFDFLLLYNKDKINIKFLLA
jgi:hypothetical protein